MIKKVVLAVFILAAAAAAFAAYAVPVRLDVSYMGGTLYRYADVEEEDLSVKTVSALGRETPVEGFRFSDASGEGHRTITATYGRLSGSCSVEEVAGTLEAEYGETVLEGDRFKESSLKVAYVYEDGTTVAPQEVEADAPDVFTDDAVIHVHTEFGDADVKVWVAVVNKILVEYPAVHQGDEFHEEDLSVSVTFADGSAKDGVEFVCTDAPEYVNEPADITVSTSYGGEKYRLDPIPAVGIRFDGKARYYAEDVFEPESVTLTYEDGETREASPVKWIEGAGEVLEEGVREVRFEWHGKEYSTSLTVHEGNRATDAARENADELASAKASVAADSVYAAAEEHENYILTHIIVVSPGRQLSGSFGGGIEYGYSESVQSAAERLDWAVGVNGGGAPPTVIIRDGGIQKEGTTDGSEICLTMDGVLFSPDPGKTGRDLAAMGVTDVWWTDAPVLIQEGVEPEYDGGAHARTILAMTGVGEYYILSASGRGVYYDEAVSILRDRGCIYARPIGGEGEVCLMIGRELVCGGENEYLDFFCVKPDRGE